MGDPVDQLSPEALQALADTDPQSLDMALLDPMRKQLQDLQDSLPDDAPPEVADQLTQMKGVVDTMVDEQIRRLNLLAAECESDWQKAVKAKRPIEDRWIDDERQFMGRPRVGDSKAYAADSADRINASREPIQVHATRSRTLMCWGRLADMMLPANDFPMRVDAPDDPDQDDFPQLGPAMERAVQTWQQQAQQAQQQQQPPPPEPDQDEILSTIAEDAANEMQQRVFQMLRDAKFQSQARKALLDTARIGCGLLKGPFPTLKKCRKFGQNQQLDVQETPTAGISWVDPWKWWYDMTPDLARSSSTYEVQILSPRELADFKRYPRTITSVIDDLLEEKDPQITGDYRASVQRRNEQTDMKEPLDGVYAVLETHKIIKPERLKDVMGIEWEYDDLPVIHMWSCNGKCIKFKLSPLERDFRLDYYNFTIMPADDTIFGYGYPYMARAAQRFADGAVNATLANAAASVAPMIVVTQGKIVPNREQWRVTGLNVFSNLNQDQPAGDGIEAIQVPSNVEQNLELLKVAKDMMDEDTLFNQILQGNVSGEDMPASGLVTMANIASVFQRSIASYADDNVFEPLCERLIWWDKLYNTDDQGNPKIPGEQVPKAIASTQMVSKDLALQHTSAFVQFAAQPEFAGMTDSYAKLQAFAQNIDGLPNRDAIIKDRDTALADNAKAMQAQQQGDPSKAAKIESDERIAMAKLQSEERMGLLKMQTDLQVAQLTYEADLANLEAKKQVDLTAISTEIQKVATNDNLERFKVTLQSTLDANLEAAKLNATPSPYSKKD